MAGLQYKGLVWCFKNEVGGFVGLSGLLHFGVLLALVVVFMLILLIWDLQFYNKPSNSL